MTRSLAFVLVRLAELALGVVGCLAPSLCVPAVMGLQWLGDRLAPPAVAP